MRISLIAVSLALAACQPDLTPEIDSLHAEIARQQREIDRLSEFVDAQADVIVVCQNAISGLMDYLINMSTLGMLREAGSQLTSVDNCSDAIARFNSIAAQRPPGPESSPDDAPLLEAP